MGVKVRKPKGYSSWCVVIDHEGQRKTCAIGSRQAAERVRREIEARLALGGMAALAPPETIIPTVMSDSKVWLETIEHERKPSTAGFYSQYLRLYVLPQFGDTPLDRVERDAVKQFIAELRSRELACWQQSCSNAESLCSSRLYRMRHWFFHLAVLRRTPGTNPPPSVPPNGGTPEIS